MYILLEAMISYVTSKFHFFQFLDILKSFYRCLSRWCSITRDWNCRVIHEISDSLKRERVKGVITPNLKSISEVSRYNCSANSWLHQDSSSFESQTTPVKVPLYYEADNTNDNISRSMLRLFAFHIAKLLFIHESNAWLLLLNI